MIIMSEVKLNSRHVFELYLYISFTGTPFTICQYNKDVWTKLINAEKIFLMEDQGSKLLYTISADFEDLHVPFLIATSMLSTATLTLAFTMLRRYISCL